MRNGVLVAELVCLDLILAKIAIWPADWDRLEETLDSARAAGHRRELLAEAGLEQCCWTNGYVTVTVSQ